ncbi:DUF3151 domain-containing protein [Corynebacterium atypicum]|uniref:DUF3151 domain-containing protein n=1 Tax=Corynebacterium atypicum TaxID=191610 RepID=UPI00056E42F8|nr:DUF3151 domain-containing protein [Corynebacterium atypicum]
MEKKDLLAPKPIYLPDDPAHHAQDILAVETAIVHPESPLVWARRTEVALEHAEKAQENARQEAGASSGRHHARPSAQEVQVEEQELDSISDPRLVAYAFARTGYHRSLDLLRANGWKGWGPVPYEHEANRGVLRAIAALARAAELIGESTEYERCRKMLADASPEAVEELL